MRIGISYIWSHAPNEHALTGLHSHFVSSLSALEGVHISMALSATKEIPAGFYESYAAFNSCILPSLGNMKSLRVLSFTLLDCLNPWGRPSLPDIARLLFYDGMQEQLNAVPYHTRIKVVVEDIMPVDTLRIDQWLELAHLRLPGCHDRLSIHICGESVLYGPKRDVQLTVCFYPIHQVLPIPVLCLSTRPQSPCRTWVLSPCGSTDQLNSISHRNHNRC